jgi:hypothetical protein
MRNASTTQVRLDGVKCSSFWMSGRATFTMDESRAFMNMARQTTTRAIHRTRPERGALEDAGGAAGDITSFDRLRHAPASQG